jgi:predicted SAM-dependent methyltransferase
MNTSIPWWLKICAKIVLSRLPFGYDVWQRLGVFRHGQMDVSEYAIRVFNSHVEKTGMSDQLRGKTLLELGPGDSIATAIIASAYGANSILLDAGAFVRSNIEIYIEFAQMLSKQGLAPVDLSGCQCIDDILARCGARYLTEGLTSLSQLESESVDLIFSQAVLEHIRKCEFVETIQECRRILKPNGICSHQVDLRDHLDAALNHLRFGDREWESDFMANSGFYTNRIRFRQMLDIFVRTGFKVEVTDSSQWDVLPTPKNTFAQEFKGLQTNELLVYRFDVVLRQ